MMKTVAIFVALFASLAGASFAQTSTPASTPTSTPTHTLGPTPLSARSVLTSYPFMYSATKTTAGTVVDDLGADQACVTTLVLGPTTPGNSVTITNGAGDTVYAVSNPIAVNFDRFGPCLDTPVSLTGTGATSIGWYRRGPNN